MLARCIIRHGTLEAIKDYPSKVSERGGDATVCEEFIALNSIREYDDSEKMIQSAFEKAILASKGALDQADEEIKQLSSRAEVKTAQKARLLPVIPHLKYILSWFVVVGIAAWMDEEKFSATLASAVVVAGTGFLCFLAYLNRGAVTTNGSAGNKMGESDRHC